MRIAVVDFAIEWQGSTVSIHTCFISLYLEMDITQICPVHRNSTTPDHTAGNVIPLNELNETCK